ncbi:MAG: T9SS type A sorting domain-containing protein [Balneolaceae bacterium]
MKTKLLIGLITICFCTFNSVFAQDYVIIEDFEFPDFAIPINNFTDGNVSNEEAFEIVENPDPDVLNPSQYVLRFLRAYDGNPWGGFWSNLPEPIDMTDMKYIHYQVLKPRISPLRFKIEGGETPNFELVSVEPQTKVGEWENITFFFPDADGEYPVIALMPDFADPVDLEENIVIYIDNIVLSNSPTPPLFTNIDEDIVIPVSFQLNQNYPNPFNPTTNITFTLDSPAHVLLTVYNTQGQKVATLVDGVRTSGFHEVKFNAEGLASGTYMYRLQSDGQSITRKLTLIK